MVPKGYYKQDRPAPEEGPFSDDPEYVGFLKDLALYHEKRGTTLEPLPMIGTHYIDLHRLYERVVEEGGYDLCSDTKAKPLMWRSFVEELVGKSKYAAAQAFQIKQIYYKNLCAYEISTHWKKDPPPKEILEDLSARGGGVMGRTLDNFARPAAGPPTDDAIADDIEGANGTPQQSQADAMDLDAPDSMNGDRSTRGLRQAPPQRVLFQPEQGGRARRELSSRIPSTSPSAAVANAVADHFAQTVAASNTTLANYEPRQSYALPLKPVTTPASNPDHYHRLKRQRVDDNSYPHPMLQRLKGVMLPGTGFTGPNIYVRAQLALQSGMLEEQEYALHHLVKISHERGDKYRFDQFPGLAEALIGKLLQITELYYETNWTVKYTTDGATDRLDELDGLHGDSRVLQKLAKSTPRDVAAPVRSLDHSRRLSLITEAALVVRNLSMLDENARFLSQIPMLNDCLVIVLSLDNAELVELQNYALEVAEQLSMYYRIDNKDPLYLVLLQQLEHEDRGVLVTSLRTIARLGMGYSENKRLDDIPREALQRVCHLLILEDDELRSACLDFLFQFSNVADQVEILLQSVDSVALVRQLTGLLLDNAKEDIKRERPRKDTAVEPHTTKVPRLAVELIEQLIKFDEPERSSHWLRMCFQDDSHAEVTQIDLWKSYQTTFAPYAVTHPHLIAGDFIKNVSTTFNGASAQVAPGTKYVIRGIRPRLVPVDYRGRRLLPCRWQQDATEKAANDALYVNSSTESPHCGIFFPNGISLLEHVFTSHLRIPRKTAAVEAVHGTHGFSYTTTLKKFDFSLTEPMLDTTCAWADCGHSIGKRVHADTRVRAALLGRHVQTHLPDGMPSADASKSGSASEKSSSRAKAPWMWLNTIQDERNDAAGTPLGACLVLRNIARAINKMSPEAPILQQALKRLSPTDESDLTAVKLGGEDGDKALSKETGKSLLMKQLFEPVKGRLFHVMAYNQVMKDHLSVLLKCISQGTTVRAELERLPNGVADE